MSLRVVLAVLLCWAGCACGRASAQVLEVCSREPAQSPTALVCTLAPRLAAHGAETDRVSIKPGPLTTAPFCGITGLPMAASRPLGLARLANLVAYQKVQLNALDQSTFTVEATQVPDGFTRARLLALNREMAMLEGSVPQLASFAVELRIPHDSTVPGFPAPVEKLATLHKLMLADAGGGKVLVSAAGQPSCEDWKAFLREVRDISWRGRGESQVARVVSLDPDKVAKALGGADGTAGAPKVTTVGTDTLVMTAATTGDDGAIAEKNRIIALLNLPRPEMSISAWSLQNSSTDLRTVSETSRLVREEVATFNEGLERTLFQGWTLLQKRTGESGYFDPPFYNYVARRVVFEVPAAAPSKAIVDEGRPILRELAAATGTDTATAARREELGICPATTYCLGYTTLFRPLQPRLMDLLLALIAAQDPVTESDRAIDAAEQLAPQLGPLRPARNEFLPQPCQSAGDPVCTIWKQMYPVAQPSSAARRVDVACETEDYADVLVSMHLTPAKPVAALNCFREAMEGQLRSNPNNSTDPTLRDVVRAAVADFLFNYKMSQQYPHEFVAYDLTTSAQAMNTALRPFVDSFIRDVNAYQAVLKRDLSVKLDRMNKELRGNRYDKPHLFENALVTVNTVAGTEATVQTATESYVEEQNAPTLSALASGVMGTDGSKAGTTGVSGLLSATRLNELNAIAGGVAQFKTQQLHLGRQLSLDVTPIALPGASAAELQVKLNADDTSESGKYATGEKADANLSRIAKSETSTRVRVDALKLFEVSSFASQLTKSKKNFPLLPPLVELPFIGSVVSLPLAPATVFHSSVAIVSAVVIPTSADLAYTARFVGDRILAPATEGGQPGCVFAERGIAGPVCRTRAMVSLSDFAGRPVRELNRLVTHCLRTHGQRTVSGAVGAPSMLEAQAEIDVCRDPGFADVTPEVQ